MLDLFFNPHSRPNMLSTRPDVDSVTRFPQRRHSCLSLLIQWHRGPLLAPCLLLLTYLVKYAFMGASLCPCWLFACGGRRSQISCGNI